MYIVFNYWPLRGSDLFRIVPHIIVWSSCSSVVHSRLRPSRLLRIKHNSFTHNSLSHTQFFHILVPLCFASLAPADLDVALVWQALRLRHWHWNGSGGGLGWSAVTPQSFAWQSWPLVTSNTTLPLTALERRTLFSTYPLHMQHFHTQLFDTHLCQLLHTHTTLSHITLSETTLYNHRSSTICFVFSTFQYAFNDCLLLLEEVDLWGYPVL